ncbi:MAG: Na+/H+ antiporter NhaA [Thermoleophilia bacterium]
MATPVGFTPEPDRSSSTRRRLVQQLARPAQRFIATEAGSAGLLLAATIVALIWANSALSSSYEELWSTELSIRLGDHALTEDLRHWVNDGLMVFFFFVVGLEIRREMAMGELTNRRHLRIPVLAAIAGIVVPAAVFLAFNPSGETAQGWGVAISTDTAFVLGVLAVAGSAVPTQLRIFVLTLAVVDDLAALGIIALFYSDDVVPAALIAAAACVVLILALGRLRVWRGPAYFAVGSLLWLAMVESGVHPAIAGVILAFCVPAYAPRREEVERAAGLAGRFRQSPDPALARSAKLSFEQAVSPNERMQALLHPWTSYVIVPVFALANAGVVIDADALSSALGSSLTVGIIAGLVVGKLIGVGLFTLLLARAGVGELPRGTGRSEMLAGGVLTGIGFTVSLFITDLAFGDSPLAQDAKIGVLLASTIAALAGWTVLRVSSARARATGRTLGPPRLVPDVDPRRDHIRGPVDAPLTLVEFSDFECPFCSRTTGMLDELRERLGDDLRYVFRHLPLTDVHGNAEAAARAAEAAASQGRFWEMHDRLFAHQEGLEPGDLLAHAEALGLDIDRFNDDMADAETDRRVREDVAAAEASGVTGTPTFFIGGLRHSGVYDADTLAARLRAAGPGRPAADRDRPARPAG